VACCLVFPGPRAGLCPYFGRRDTLCGRSLSDPAASDPSDSLHPVQGLRGERLSEALWSVPTCREFCRDIRLVGHPARRQAAGFQGGAGLCERARHRTPEFAVRSGYTILRGPGHVPWSAPACRRPVVAGLAPPPFVHWTLFDRRTPLPYHTPLDIPPGGKRPKMRAVPVYWSPEFAARVYPDNSTSSGARPLRRAARVGRRGLHLPRVARCVRVGMRPGESGADAHRTGCRPSLQARAEARNRRGPAPVPHAAGRP
jgi:hypothetical protein